MISIEEYFAGHPAFITDWKANASSMLGRANRLMAEALLDGVRFVINPDTHCNVAGNGNGGIRPFYTDIGASFSNHKRARAVDVYDHFRDYASWCMAHLDRLQAHGIFMEDPRWTWSDKGNHWVHHQDIPPHSGKIVYIPSELPPLGPWPDKWQGKKAEVA